jgi:hypothetical protein
MGHEEDARQIAIARERHLYGIGRIGQVPREGNKIWAAPKRVSVRALHWAFGVLVGYGYRPLRLVGWMMVVWLLLGAGYWSAAQKGIFAPSNPLVFNHPEYAHCRPNYEQDPGNPHAKRKVGNWYHCPELAGEYTGFSPMVYSLALILPLVDLQQEHDWAPFIPTPKPVWYQELLHVSLNHVTRWLVWFEILFGWIASLLLAAILTGLTNRDRT